MAHTIAMQFNYDNRFFRGVSNTSNGEVSSETLFHYRQKKDVVWATYGGGDVVFGTLIARVEENGCLDMRYLQLNRKGGGGWESAGTDRHCWRAVVTGYTRRGSG